jgi:hypothetical protein
LRPETPFNRRGEVLRELLTSNKELAAILSAIRELMNPTTRKRRGVGFTAKL